MTWARDLIQVPTLLLELVSLVREQNSLHRELIVALTGRAPSTRLTTPSPIFVRPPLTRKYTADDVSVVTREMRLEQQRQDEEKRTAPWRTPVDDPASSDSAPSSNDAAAAPTSASASPLPSPGSPSLPQP